MYYVSNSNLYNVDDNGNILSKIRISTYVDIMLLYVYSDDASILMAWEIFENDGKCGKISRYNSNGDLLYEYTTDYEIISIINNYNNIYLLQKNGQVIILGRDFQIVSEYVVNVTYNASMTLDDSNSLYIVDNEKIIKSTNMSYDQYETLYDTTVSNDNLFSNMEIYFYNDNLYILHKSNLNIYKLKSDGTLELITQIEENNTTIKNIFIKYNNVYFVLDNNKVYMMDSNIYISLVTSLKGFAGIDVNGNLYCVQNDFIAGYYSLKKYTPGNAISWNTNDMGVPGPTYKEVYI
jgi:hypothetical protein